MRLRKVIVGAGRTSQPGWVSLEEGQLDIRNVLDWLKLFDPYSLSAILAEHVLEHLSMDEALLAVKCFHLFLKRGGYVRLAVPDGFHPMGNYIDWVRPGGIWNPRDHKSLFDYRTLTALLERAGFNVRLLEWHDEAGTLHLRQWKESDGHISRTYSSLYSQWFLSPIVGAYYSSLIVDAYKL